MAFSDSCCVLTAALSPWPVSYADPSHSPHHYCCHLPLYLTEAATAISVPIFPQYWRTNSHSSLPWKSWVSALTEVDYRSPPTHSHDWVRLLYCPIKFSSNSSTHSSPPKKPTRYYEKISSIILAILPFGIRYCSPLPLVATIKRRWHRTDSHLKTLKHP